MKKSIKVISQVASLSLTLVAGATYADSFRDRVAAFGSSAVNTGLFNVYGITINGQVTHPNVFVFPAEHQEWFTTVRTCFNPLFPDSAVTITPTSILNQFFPAQVMSTLNVPVGLGSVGGFVGPTLTGGALTGGLFNLLAGITTPTSSTSVTVNYTIYRDDGSVAKNYNDVTIPANGCDMHTSDVRSDPLFAGVDPGIYTIVADAPILEVTTNQLTSLHIGFLYGTSNSTGRNLLKLLNLDPTKK